MRDADGKIDNEIAFRPLLDGKFLMVLFGFTIVFLNNSYCFGGIFCCCCIKVGNEK